MTTAPPVFDDGFRRSLETLLAWRRDVRHFRTDPVPGAVIEHCLDLACLAPSVGNSQPWRFVRVDTAERRAGVIENFSRANAAALAAMAPERQAAYARLKLAGLREAPVHLAVFCDEATAQGHGLGRRTMPETLRYSVVTAIHTFWLAARAEGLGVGWVSILDPERLVAALAVPERWSLVAYLCIGWPAQADDTPELERRDWQLRQRQCREVLRR